MAINHAKEFLKSVDTIVVFLQFWARASNGPRPSYVESWCLKISKETLEGMLLTNLGVNHCKSIIKFVLTYSPVQNKRTKSILWCKMAFFKRAWQKVKVLSRP